jgi:hypothetical protein
VVTVAHDAKQHFNNGTDDLPFSISFWANTDFAVAGGLVAKYQAGATEFLAWVTGNGLRFALSDGTDEPYIQTASLIAHSNKWTHITITSEGAGPNFSNDFPAAIDALKVYVNADDITSGATKQNEAAYSGLNNSSAAITLMSFASGNFKKGSIRGVKIFNKSLTATEIAELARGNDLGFADESSTFIEVDNFEVVSIGTLADFRAEDYNESASKLLDRSSNNFVGVGTSVTLTGNQRHISADTIDLKNLPTSSAGLSAGEVWSNSGVLTVV